MRGDETRSNVIDLASRRNRAGGCFAAIEAHWRALCAGRLVPDRDELDPRAIAAHLDRTFVVERVAPGVARFRIAGAHLQELMGMEVRGMPLTAMIAPGSREDVAAALDAVFDEPARVDLALRGRAGMRTGRLTARLLLLPLRDDRGGITRAIGCLAASQPPKRTPVRFALIGQERRTLIGYGARPGDGPARDGPHLVRPD